MSGTDFFIALISLTNNKINDNLKRLDASSLSNEVFYMVIPDPVTPCESWRLVFSPCKESRANSWHRFLHRAGGCNVTIDISGQMLHLGIVVISRNRMLVIASAKTS